MSDGIDEYLRKKVERTARASIVCATLSTLSMFAMCAVSPGSVGVVGAVSTVLGIIAVISGLIGVVDGQRVGASITLAALGSVVGGLAAGLALCVAFSLYGSGGEHSVVHYGLF